MESLTLSLRSVASAAVRAQQNPHQSVSPSSKSWCNCCSFVSCCWMPMSVVAGAGTGVDVRTAARAFVAPVIGFIRDLMTVACRPYTAGGVR